MPVTTGQPNQPRLPVRGLNNAGRVEPAAFLQHLRLTTGTAPPRFRLEDFMDEAPCPLSSDGEGNEEYSEEEEGSSSGDEDMEDTLPEGLPLSLPGPSACSYLSMGQSFIGSQRLSNAPARAVEDWQVLVRIQGVDLARGTVCGVMEAMNVPHARSTIVTFWEGEIVDNNNFSFLTQKWGASRDIDLKHWAKFPGFSALEDQVVRHAGKTSLLSTTPYIFMRWKEMFFVNTSESCGLTIAGFYYVCLDRQSGAVQGYYYDPNSAPFQFLSLKPMACTGGGMAFGSYELR